MLARNYYINLAITGMGQSKDREINIFLISDYLQKYAEIVAKDKWDTWLESLGLYSVRGIKDMLQELRGVKVWKK